jgi:hypothetical protein
MINEAYCAMERRLSLVRSRLHLRTRISEKGQNAQYSSRVDVFRFAPESGGRLTRSALRICANVGSDADHTYRFLSARPK